MVSMTFGVFPPVSKVKRYWEANGGEFYWDLKGGIHLKIAHLAGLDNDWRPTTVTELFAGVRKILHVAMLSDRTLEARLRKEGVRYDPDELRQEAESLASDVMQVAVNVEWI